MTTQQPLRQIIRRHEGDPPPNNADEVLYTLDTKQGLVVVEDTKMKLIFAAQPQRRRLYVVNSLVRIKDSLQVEVASLSHSLELRLEFQVNAIPDQRKRLVEACFKAHGPEKALHGTMRRVIEEHADRVGRTEFVQRAHRELDAIKAAIVHRVHSELGLALDLRIQLLAPSAAPRTITIQDLSIIPIDTPTPVFLQIKCSLREDGTSMMPRLTSNDELTRTLADAARRALDHRYGLEVLHAQLKTKIEASLQQELTQAGRVLGWTPVALQLSLAGQGPDWLSRALPEKEGHCTFEHNNPNYPEPIRVEVSYRLERTDLAKFERSGAPELGTWLEKEVRSEASKLLFDVSYADLCNRFAVTKTQLEARMTARAEAIGYSLRQFVAITNHQLDRLARGIELGPIEGQFSLRGGSWGGPMRVRVGAELNVRITDFARVVPVVQSGRAVVDSMIEKIQETMGSVLRRTEPQHFFLEFEEGADGADGTERRKSIAAQLSEAVEEKLKQEFSAQLVRPPQFTMLESDVHACCSNLLGRVENLTLTVDIPGSPEPVRYGLRYRVIMIQQERWQTFQRMKPTPTDLERAIEGELSSQLTLATYAELVAPSSRDQLKVFMQRLIAKRALDDFGLVVELLSNPRLAGELDEAKRKASQKDLLDDVAVTTKLIADDRQGQLDTSEQFARRLRHLLDDETELMQKLSQQRAMLGMGKDEDDLDPLREQLEQIRKEQRELTEKRRADANAARLSRARAEGHAASAYDQTAGGRLAATGGLAALAAGLDMKQHTPQLPSTPDSDDGA